MELCPLLGPQKLPPQLMFFQLSASPESMEWGQGGGERARPPGPGSLASLSCRNSPVAAVLKLPIRVTLDDDLGILSEPHFLYL